ncbi:polymer-forming cytoskeletal protein [Phycisphaerales bacterium AB-hyl4]|uniref:Polymer-forming cytoskeletal protein n=1 Tax=Natronomicrosphaera hydrolytica TaxID=3242702 RepID=A0ABV4U926_9BACT
MARQPATRKVQCYHCRHRFDVSGRAQSTSCPGCYKPVIVGDVVVTTLKPVTEVRTCGSIVVKKKGRIIARVIEAHGGIDCEGAIDAKTVQGGLGVRLGPKAVFKGDLLALSLRVEEGARVTGGFFDIPNNDLDLTSLGEEGS